MAVCQLSKGNKLEEGKLWITLENSVSKKVTFSAFKDYFYLLNVFYCY